MEAWFQNQKHQTIQTSHQHQVLNIRTIQQIQRNQVNRSFQIVPGYEPHLPDPKDPTKPGQPIQPGTPVTPDKPGEDTPIIYVPKTTEVTKPTKQTVTFEGAGDNTPAAKVQNDFTFTGKQKNGTTTWDQPNHTYGKETVPVVEHYYADKKEAGSKTVTPDQPEVRIRLLINHLVRSSQLMKPIHQFQVHQLHNTTMIQKIQLRVA